MSAIRAAGVRPFDPTWGISPVCWKHEEDCSGIWAPTDDYDTGPLNGGSLFPPPSGWISCVCACHHAQRMQKEVENTRIGLKRLAKQ